MKRFLQENRTLFMLLLFFISSLVFLSSCSGVTPTDYNITATAGAGGSINPSGAIVVSEGGSQTFTFTPDECYQIADVLVDSISVGLVSAYTFVSIQQDFNIHVNFFPGPGVKNIDTGVEYASIQAAIDDALAGETIVICPGAYYENIIFDGKNINLQSTDPSDPAIVDSTVIDGGGVGSVIWFIGGDTSALKGFTIRNGNNVYGGGIYINNSSPTIENNIITDNIATGLGGGIRVSHSSPTITNNTITYNIANAYGGGMYVDLDSELLPSDSRPIGWGTGREDIPTGATLDPAEGEEYTIAGNEFLGNKHGTSSDYTEGAHVYFN